MTTSTNDTTIFIVIDHGDADVLGAYLVKSEAQGLVDYLIDCYPYVAIEETTIDLMRVLEQ